MAPFPSKTQILDFITASPGKVGKREIARAFHIKGADRVRLKELLREMAEEGLIERGRRGGKGGALPPVAVIDLVDQDVDGELLGRPVDWRGTTPPPKIILAPGDGGGVRKRGKSAVGGPALGIGDRVLARLKRLDDGSYEARLIKRLGQSAHRILGIYRDGPTAAEGRVLPVDRRTRYEMRVDARDAGNARSGDLVTVETTGRQSYGLKRVRVLEILGRITDQRSVSLIAIHRHGIPTGFTADEEQQAEQAKPLRLGRRTDLRTLPLVTIDPVDARDFDDAVHAMPDTDPKNEGGWIVTVAIADVAHYVPPASPLDQGALKRGNSCYFPDRVVPMLPERLSNELCSLRPGEDRPCLAVRMVFDREGRRLRHEFFRGLMRSHARLTYQQAQSAIDGRPDHVTAPLLDPLLKPLWGAYRALEKERARREPLDLDLPEHKIELAADGTVTAVRLAERLDAHRLIEEFMIQANVAAAETLSKKRIGFLYRVHDAPAQDKLESLRDFLKTLGLTLAKGQHLRPHHFNALLRKVKGSEMEAMVSEVVLRSQSQAVYSPHNLGHFGLNLRHYAHFTSPIRRYADLIVHRALIRAEGLGTDGLLDEDVGKLEDIGETISNHERRAMAAERESTDRYIAAYLSERVGALFRGRITGVTRFGLFVKLTETGADGIVPIRSLDDDYYRHDESRHALVGVHQGGVYRLGAPVEVKLEEATPLTGGLRFDMVTPPEHGVPGHQARPSPRPRPRKSKRRKKTA